MLGLGSIWNPRTQLPTLASLELLLRLGAERGLDVAEWLCSDAEEIPLEACQADWRPVIGELASDPFLVPSVADSVASFNRHVRPMERARGTRAKYSIGCRCSHGQYGRASCPASCGRSPVYER